MVNVSGSAVSNLASDIFVLGRKKGAYATAQWRGWQYLYRLLPEMRTPITPESGKTPWVTTAKTDKTLCG
jgi:hypothetical protein